MSVWFKGLRLKLLIMAILPVLFFLGMGLKSYFNLKNNLHVFDEHSKVLRPAAQAANDLYINIERQMLTYLALNLNRKPSEARNELLSEVELSKTNFQKAYDKLKAIKDLEGEQWLAEGWVEFEKAWVPANELFSKIDGYYKSGTDTDLDSAAVLLAKDGRVYVDTLEDILGKLTKRAEEVANSFDELGSKDAQTMLWFLSLMIVVGALFIFGLGIWTAQAMSKGLTGIAGRIGASGQSVYQSSSQLTTASQRLSSGSTEAASSLEETVSSLEELSSMVKQNADNAREASALSASARSSAEEGEHEIQSLIAAMVDIAGSSKKIEEIINVIDDIAFQTNLLALNAAVEAARAGEQGRGFAVVAEAVRSLAQRSSAAAKDINGLIKDSVSKVDRGTKIADNSGVALKTIVTSVKKVADLNNEISAASQEQATGLSQISKAMNQLDQATQSNAASAEETYVASQRMATEANELEIQVRGLRSFIDGGGLNSTAPAGNDSSVSTYSNSNSNSGSSSSSGSGRYDGFHPAPSGSNSSSDSYGSGKGNAKVLNFNRNNSSSQASQHSAPAPAAGGGTGRSSASATASQLIPFDEDVPSDAKVGSLDGF